MGTMERLTNGTTGGPVFVYVQDGRIVRITPMDLDDTDAPSWTIEARGRRFTPPRKTTITPYSLSWRSMVYSPKRNLYPMKRVDFDPTGNRNCAKRGISGYERISWDEAADIVTGEVKRIKREYGPGAILSTASSHHLWGNIGYRHSAYFRFANLMGFCYADHNPDSWEGWHWGGMHNWGFSHRLGIPEQYDLLQDALKNTEMIVFWSSDPETTNGIYSAFESTPRRQWLKESGREDGLHRSLLQSHRRPVRRQMVCPETGSGQRHGLRHRLRLDHGGPLRQGSTSRATPPVSTPGKTISWAKTDGVPKSPEWAEKESNIPAREIKALAREWASKKTMLAAGGLGGWGGACRSATRQRVGAAHDQPRRHAGDRQARAEHLVHHPGRTLGHLLHVSRLHRRGHIGGRGQQRRRVSLRLSHVQL